MPAAVPVHGPTTAAPRISGPTSQHHQNGRQPEIRRGEVVLLHDLDHAADGRAPVTLCVVTADEGARALAGAVQEQAELHIIHNRQTQGFVAAAVAVG